MCHTSAWPKGEGLHHPALCSTYHTPVPGFFKLFVRTFLSFIIESKATSCLFIFVLFQPPPMGEGFTQGSDIALVVLCCGGGTEGVSVGGGRSC